MQADPTTSARQQVSLAISGMSCGHCVSAVTEVLGALEGVQVQRVALGAATVALDPQVTSSAAVVAAVRAAGYEAREAARPLPQAPGTTCCSPPSA